MGPAQIEHSLVWLDWIGLGMQCSIKGRKGEETSSHVSVAVMTIMIN